MKYIFSLALMLLLVRCNNISDNNISSDKNYISKANISTILGIENLKGDVVILEEDGNIVFFNNNALPEKKLTEVKGLKGISYVVEYTYTNKDIVSNLLKAKGFNMNTRYFYDSSGVITSSENITKFDDDLTTFTEMNYYKYNENKRLILDSINEVRFTKYFYTENKLDSSKDELRTNIYSNGNIIKQIIHEVDEKGNISPKVIVKTFEYKYDAYGNWIVQQSFVGGRPDKIVNRKILYMGQDISEYEKKFNDFIASIGGSENISNSPVESNDNSGSTNVIVGGATANNSYNSNSSSTQINEREKRICSDCNGTGKCRTCSKVFKTRFWGGKYSGWKNRNETRSGLIMCDVCNGAGVFYKKGDYPNMDDYVVDKKCYVSSCRNGWKYCPECNYSGNGRNLGQCSDCRGTGYRE